MLVENDQLVHVRTTEIPTAPNEDEMNRLDEGVQVISLSFENSNNFQNNIKLYGNGGGGGEHKSVKDNQFASSNSDIASDSDSNDEEDCDSDIISNYIGHYGRWQFIWTFLLCLFQLPTTFHIFSFVFQGLPQDFWCQRPDHLLDVPLTMWQNLTRSMNQCQMLNADYGSMRSSQFTVEYFSRMNQSDMVACKRLEYDHEFMGNTLIAEWGLVCERKYIMSIVEMCFLAGAGVGSVCSGWISDQYGRKHSLIIFAVIQAVIGTIIGFVTSLAAYMVLRFVIGFACMSVTVISFVLVVELVSGKWRTVIGILNILPVAISYMLAAGIAYVTFDWRVMQFAITAPTFILILMWFKLPESPRWLLARGRIDELVEIIERAAKCNNLTLPFNYVKTLKAPEKTKITISVLDLFRREYLRTTLCMIIIWFSIILIYFGTTLHMSNLGGNIYLNTVIAGGVESISICLSVLVVLKLGLRINLFIYMLVAGLSCLIMNLSAPDNLWFVITLAMIVKCTIGACNAIIPTFTAFQYPTILRNLGVGAGNFAAGLALVTVPYLWLLEHFHIYLPMTVMGIVGIIGGFSLFLLNDKSIRNKKIDEREQIQVHLGTAKEEGLSNVGFSQNESIYL